MHQLPASVSSPCCLSGSYNVGLQTLGFWAIPVPGPLVLFTLHTCEQASACIFKSNPCAQRLGLGYSSGMFCTSSPCSGCDNMRLICRATALRASDVCCDCALCPSMRRSTPKSTSDILIPELPQTTTLRQHPVANTSSPTQRNSVGTDPQADLKPQERVCANRSLT